MAIKFEASRGNFTSLDGLSIFSELFDCLDLKRKLLPLLPSAKKQALLDRNFCKANFFAALSLGSFDS